MKANQNLQETEKMKAMRHEEWKRSLAYKRRAQEGGVVIKMPIPKFGKTAHILSEREIEVLQLVSFGYSSRQIAEELNLSLHTVTNHRKNMLTRSRCGNLAELVRVAINENLL